MEVTRKIHLAVVDDDPLFLDHVSTFLAHQGGMHVVQAKSGRELFRALDAGPVDCVVLDYDLGDETGLSVGEKLRESLNDPPPVIMLTVKGSERTAIKAFRSGFSDYVSKRNLDTNELLSAIQQAVGRREQAKLARQQATQFQDQVQLDPVTDLSNVAHTRQRLEEMIANKERVSFGLLTVQLREFSQIKAGLGRDIADRVRRDFARRINKPGTGFHFCGHLDESTFVCVVDRSPVADRTEATAAILAEQLTFEAEFDRILVRVAPAIGVAIFPQNGTDLDVLLDQAHDARGASAMNGTSFGVAKNAGQNDETTPDGASTSSVFVARTENRNARRQRVLKRGRIMMADVSTVIDCTVRDLSSKGARLRVESYFDVPEKFRLQVVGTGDPKPVELRWRNGNELGVLFVEHG